MFGNHALNANFPDRLMCL